VGTRGSAHLEDFTNQCAQSPRGPSAALPNSGLLLHSTLALFGTLYFIQGIVEPTACLPAQPIQSHLRHYEFSATQIGQFFGVIGIAWSLKPLFGLISDFLPIGGHRRLPYLVLSTGTAAVAFFACAALLHLPAGEHSAIKALLWPMLIAGLGVAMTDVVIDAVAVETGQPRGITGQIQSVQWFALALAQVLVGFVGGHVSQHQLQRPMFVGCGLLALVSLVIVLLMVREPQHSPHPKDNLAAAWNQIRSGRRLPILLSAAAFLFLWNFNPFSSNVLQEYMTKELHFSEQFYGNTVSIQALGQILGCVSYFAYCRRVPFGLLIHGSIVAGIASSLCYWLLHDAITAFAVSFLWGFAWQTGLLVQLDLSARICPTEAAGTVFATLMAITNTATSLATYLGGGWYDALAVHFHANHTLAFHTLAAIGAALTAACWLLVPVMKKSGVQWN
jgi:predicted MFS family arabinose efflux permease